MTNIKHQKGVALLFALGILSLILVMGLAFLGNSLISQKIAFNNKEGASARFYARNAVDRAIAHLTLFNLVQARDHATFYAPDASSVFSRNNTTGTIAIAGENQTTGNALAAFSQDQLAGNDSKLNVEKKYDTSWYAGKNSAAKWIYVHQNGAETNGDTPPDTDNPPPIIARYAYQVLPQTSLSRISLYGVTAGVNGIAGITPAAANPRIPHTHRWGMDVDELAIPGLNNMFSTYWGNGVSPNLAIEPQYEFDNFINLLAGNSAPNPFNGNSRDIENRKRWLRHIFVEGKGRVAREAYGDGYNWYPRFNLGRRSTGTDPWYSRFLRVGEAESIFDAGGAAPRNSANILDRLAAAPVANNVIYKFDDSKVRDSDYTNQTGHNGIGLPFLRSIGDAGTSPADAQKGAFEAVENLRKQIAANLNDYCDSDSIPTSDVPASSWGGLAGVTTGLPSYTGNEKTPYINEVGFGFKLHDSSFSSSEAEYRFKTDIHAAVFAELINIYPGLTVASARLRGLLKGLSVTLEVSVTGNVAAGTYMKDGAPVNYSEFSFTDAKKEGTFTFTVPVEGKDFDINFGNGNNIGSGGEKGPYWVNINKVFDRPASGNNVSETIDLAKEIFKQDGNVGWVTSDSWNNTPSSINVTLSDIKIKVKSVTFNLGNLILEMPTGTGVDFVKVASGDRVSSSTDGKDILAVTSVSDLATQTGDGKGYFYAGGMQVIDPRQNLHANLANVGDATNEWHNSFEPTIGDESATTVPTWDDITGSSTAAGSVIGRRNVCSNPSAPLYSNGTTAIPANSRDTETVSSPQYIEAVAGATPIPESMISTAVIRNKPMRSPWELGFIHRGIPFQTINLKRAGGIDGGDALDNIAHDAGNFTNWNEPRGTRYEYGDAGILDQIKMTEFNKSYGKVDMTTLRATATPDWWIPAAAGGAVDPIDTLNRNIFKALFENMRNQTAAQFLEESENFETVPAPPTPPATSTWLGTVLNPNPVADDFAMNSIPSEELRSKIFNNGTMAGIFVVGNNDAAQEERIGKSVNLIEAESCSMPNVFKIVVVVQTIRDLSGNIVRLDRGGNNVQANAAFGRFDANIGVDIDSSIYFDEILSECRMLVTVEKIHYMDGTNPRARLRVKQIEYLD